MPYGGNIIVKANRVDIADKEIADLGAGSYVLISISDSGEGIAARDLAKIFDPFFTTKEDGYGMGLSISHSIVRAHSKRVF